MSFAYGSAQSGTPLLWTCSARSGGRRSVHPLPRMLLHSPATHPADAENDQPQDRSTSRVSHQRGCRSGQGYGPGATDDRDVRRYPGGAWLATVGACVAALVKRLWPQASGSHLWADKAAATGSIALTMRAFGRAVSRDGVTLVDFWATWCGLVTRSGRFVSGSSAGIDHRHERAQLAATCAHAADHRCGPVT